MSALSNILSRPDDGRPAIEGLDALTNNTYKGNQHATASTADAQQAKQYLQQQAEAKPYTPYAQSGSPNITPTNSAEPKAPQPQSKPNAALQVALKANDAVNNYSAKQAEQTQPAMQQSNYSELIDYLQNEAEAAKAQMETPEQRAKREKREKWNKITSGIGDAVSSLSNLFFTTRYAPNMYNPHQSYSAANENRAERAKADRDKLRDNYINYALKIGGIKDNDRDFAYKQQQAAAAQAQRDHDNAIADAKEARDAALANVNLLLTGQKITAAEAEARKKQAEADYAQAIQQANLEKAKAQTQAARASASASRARAGESQARTQKIYHDMATDGTGRKKFVTGASVRQKNWDNDDYIDQLYRQVSNANSYIGSDGKKHIMSAGAANLFQSTNDALEETTDSGRRANLMRGAIEELLTNNYDNAAQTFIGASMEDFDNRYTPKK